MAHLLLRIFIISIVWFLARLVLRAALRPRYRQSPGPSGPWGEPPRGQSRGQPPGPSSRAKSPYEVMEVRPGASREEITAAYRRLVHQYHPDKVANLAPEFRELAEQRMKEINAAYEHLKRRASR